jgi:drug/metabolite transporter (DMT)-like permease
MNGLYVGITLVAAMLTGSGFVLQQHAAEQVQDAEFLHLGLIARLVHNRRWLTGIVVMAAGYLVQAWTLGHLTLSVTEPLLTTNLIFALVLAVPLSKQPLRRTEIVGAVLLTAGVAALSLTRSVKAPSESFGSTSHWPAAAAIALIAAFLVHLGRKRSGVVRATLTGIAAGLVLGIADAFTRRSVQIIDGRHPFHLLLHWPGYATVVASIIALWLVQNAFNAAPLHASLPAVTAAEPTAGIVLGVLVFGDKVHITPLLVAVQVAGAIALVVGVILVARAPVFSNLRLRELPLAALERLQHPPPIPDSRAGSGPADVADAPNAISADDSVAAAPPGPDDEPQAGFPEQVADDARAADRERPAEAAGAASGAGAAGVAGGTVPLGTAWPSTTE